MKPPYPFVLSLLAIQPLLASQAPNVILFMADDMGMGDTSAYQDITGNSDAEQIDTPAMEKLARAGVRFSDAHTPSSRCSPTRYGLLTGRYPWRNRLKQFVLFGSQGDPTIEADRPTLGSLFQSAGYRTGLVGKWHVGLRYTRDDGTPAAGFRDADLTRPLLDGPVQHGFDFARFTSRSHGTSGPDEQVGARKKRNSSEQDIGPGHIHGSRLVSASGDGRQLVADGPDAYRLRQLGGRHSRHAADFIARSVAERQPFFLYYPSNSNHTPYTPDERLAPAGSGRSKSGAAMGRRYDYIYENDVALGSLIDYLEKTDDPRAPGRKLIHNSVVIFTSDNGAEIKAKSATGPFRSHKGSCFEGGHRVPFIVSWPAGGIVGGGTSGELINLVDLYATFAEILDTPLPDLRQGEKGAEDSRSSLAAWRGEALPPRPHFYHDHSEAEGDKAVSAMRLDDAGAQWKIFFQPGLLRRGVAEPFALYNLASDPLEQHNLIGEPDRSALIKRLTATAGLHRNATGHRATSFAPDTRVRYTWQNRPEPEVEGELTGLELDLQASGGRAFHANRRGLGIAGGKVNQVDGGEAFLIRFNQDVLVESVGLVAGNGRCGGFYQVGEGGATQDIYCIDAHIDSHDQSGLLSDIGVLRAGEVLRLDSSPHHQNETPGQWRLASLSLRPLPVQSPEPEGSP